MTRVGTTPAGWLGGVLAAGALGVALTLAPVASAQDGSRPAAARAPVGDEGRVVVEVGAGLLPAVLTFTIAYLVWSAEVARCPTGPDAWLSFCGLGSAFGGYVIGVPVTLITTPLLTGLVHSAAGGRGGAGWMLLGGLLGLVGGALVGGAIGAAVWGGDQGRALAGSVVWHVMTELGFVSGLVIGLEVSHADAVRASSTPPSNPFAGATAGFVGSF